MLSIDLSDAGQKGKARSRKLKWGLPPQKRFMPTAASESSDWLINRDLDAAGRIRVVSDQNLRMSCEPDSVWKSYSKQKLKNRKC